MTTFKVFYTEMTPVPNSEYTMLNAGYDYNQCQTEVLAESEDDVYMMFADSENRKIDLVEPKY